VLNRQSDRALYQQLADTLREAIYEGVYPPGEPVPSETILVERFGISRAAVRRAIAILQHEGLIVCARGMPTTVRKVVSRQEIRLNAGDRLTARMPSEPERTRQCIAPGVPLFEISRRNGTVDVLVSDRVAVVGWTAEQPAPN
jgi:DNA-binding GntR family transcriptional regulator